MMLAGCQTNGGGTPTSSPTATPSPTETPTPDEPAQDATVGGTFTYGMSSQPDTSNILRSGSVYSAVALALVYEYGVATDPVTYEPKPWVYTDWKIENIEGEDAKPDVYANVRDGLKWADGKEFTVDDLLWGHNYVLENEPGELSGFWDAVSKVEKSGKDDWDLHFKMTRKIGTWVTTVLSGCPMLPPQQWKGKDFKAYEPVEGSDGRAFSLGPGVLTKFEASTSMQVKFREDGEPVNPSYYETLSQLDWREEHDQIIAGGPFVDQVNFKVYGSESAMTQAFLQGDIDTHYGTMSTSKIPQVQDTEGQSLVNGFDSGFSYQGYNLRHKPLDDVTFRQVLAMIWDDFYWITRLNRDFAIKGDYAHSPGYRAARPETRFGGEDTKLLTDPATNAFDFRQSKPGVPDIEGLKSFLKNGEVISGSGTYVGKEFPGTLSGVEASQSEAQYDYSWGPIESDVLKDTQGVEEEIRVDGKTIPELKEDGEPIVYLIDPPQKAPRESKAIENWVENARLLGIPVKTKVLSFNTMVNQVYMTEEFDIYTMGWAGTSPYGTSLWFFFHSDNADTTGENEGFVYNSTGYGIEGLDGYNEGLADAYTTMDINELSKKFAKANERIYLDQPYTVWDYAKVKWPINSAKWAGYVGNVVDPAYASWGLEANNLHQKEE